jgi:flagellar biosynthesis/type III secretory pathway protein FliH
LLQAPAIHVTSRTLMAPDPTFDPSVTAAIEAAYARGRMEGEAAGRAAGAAEAVEDARRAVAALQAALTQAVAACREARQLQSRDVVELAAAIAAVVIGREPSADTAALLDRVTTALDMLDDPSIVVAANPADVAALEAGLTGIDLRVTPDPSLLPGEARLVGRWATAELTREAGWAAVSEVLAQ